jgi:multimeric flavodoxin WrbA
MSIVILDAMEGINNISIVLKEKLQADKALAYFKLEDMNVAPCRSCGACGFKSPGKCVVNDDSHKILEAIAKGNVLVMLTPIRFGGYSSTLKKAVDKFMNLCLPSYTVKHGHLVHPARYGSKSIVAIGINEGDSGEQEESFKKLIENNALNLQASCETIVFKASGDIEVIDREISRLFGEAC